MPPRNKWRTSDLSVCNMALLSSPIARLSSTTSFKIASRLTVLVLSKSFTTYPRVLTYHHPMTLNHRGHQIIRSNIMQQLHPRCLSTNSSLLQPSTPKKTDVDSIVQLINQDNGLLEGLLQLDQDELAMLLAHITNEARISTTMLKMSRMDLPSFSLTKWSEFAKDFGLPEDASLVQLKPFTTPRYCLPMSMQVSMFENAWHWHDVYGEKVDHTREVGRVRILDPYIVPIVALFQGRLNDKPEQAMMRTKYSTGGDVDHEIFMITGVIFFVVELKHGTPDDNNLAKIFLELLSAAEMNKSINLKGLRVYGLLTDLIQFKFYSYDPNTNTFCFDETIVIDNRRMITFSEMVDVANKIFGIVLSGYMDSLQACVMMKKNSRGEHHNNIPCSPQKALDITDERKNTRASGLESTDQWEVQVALTLAESCCAKFREPMATLPDIEKRGNEALGLLMRSVRSIPRVSTFTGGDNDPSTPGELKALATRIAKETYKHYLTKE